MRPRALPQLLILGLSIACGPKESVPAAGPPPSAPASAPSIAQAAASTTVPLPPPFVPTRVWREGKAMGTHLAFAGYTNPQADEAAVQAAFEAAIHEFERIELMMTTWRTDSELSQVNASAGKAPVPVSDETRFVIEESLRASQKSEGTFDITFETLHGLWKFDEDLDPHPPKPADITKRLKHVGYAHVKVDAAKRTVFLDDPETRISLGGIAKGYAVDQAARVIEKAGVTSFFVQAGGDLFARGKKPDGAEWSSGIRDPRGPANKYFAVLPISDHAFSTAGDYERSYVVGNKRYHHIIDPRTGYPATACRSVTIWAKSALLADAIDDAVFILGPRKGMDLVESLEDVGAVIVDAKNNLWVSKRLQGKLVVTGAPTDGI